MIYFVTKFLSSFKSWSFLLWAGILLVFTKRFYFDLRELHSRHIFSIDVWQLTQATVQRREMTSSISSLVRIWKIRQWSSCLRVVYFPVKHLRLYNKLHLLLTSSEPTIFFTVRGVMSQHAIWSYTFTDFCKGQIQSVVKNIPWNTEFCIFRSQNVMYCLPDEESQCQIIFLLRSLAILWCFESFAAVSRAPATDLPTKNQSNLTVRLVFDWFGNRT